MVSESEADSSWETIHPQRISPIPGVVPDVSMSPAWNDPEIVSETLDVGAFQVILANNSINSYTLKYLTQFGVKTALDAAQRKSGHKLTPVELIELEQRYELAACCKDNRGTPTGQDESRNSTALVVMWIEGDYNLNDLRSVGNINCCHCTYI